MLTSGQLIDSTLFQKSLGTYIESNSIGYKENVLSTYTTSHFPFTGVGCPTCGVEAEIGDWFSQLLKIWNIGGGVYPNIWFTIYQKDLNRYPNKNPPANGIIGFFNITATGLAFQCLEPVILSTNASSLPLTASTSTPNSPNSQLLFDLSFTPVYSNAARGVPDVPDGPDAWLNNTSYINMEIAYANASSDDSMNCPGKLTTQVCRLRPAVITYPVQSSQPASPDGVLNFNDWTVTLAVEDAATNDEGESDFYLFNATNRQQNYHHVVSYVTTVEFPEQAFSSSQSFTYGNTTVGAIAAAFQDYLGGQAWLSKSDTNGMYNLSTTGSAQSYLETFPSPGQCDYQFSDPTVGGAPLVPSSGDKGAPRARFVDPGVVGKINSIMFGLMSWAAFDPRAVFPDKQYGEAVVSGATVYANTIHYSSNYKFMGGAIASTLICLLLVLPSYW